MTRSALFSFVLAPLVACPPPSEDSGDPQTCDMMAVSSVQVAVTVSDGGPPPTPEDGLVVQYSVDGGTPMACDDLDAASYVCGYEQVGRFVIQGSADGFEPAEIAVDIELDEEGCHPVTRAVELSLSPTDEAG